MLPLLYGGMEVFARISRTQIHRNIQKRAMLSHRSFGGDGETRTLAPVSQPTPLAGAPRHQLEYISKLIAVSSVIRFVSGWNKRVGGEEGIRTLGSDESLVFKTSSLNRSDTSPSVTEIILAYPYLKVKENRQKAIVIFQPSSPSKLTPALNQYIIR